MIRTTPGDLIAVKYKRRHYYAVVLTRQILFGGQLVFALYHSSKSLEDAEQVLKHGLKGFHCIIDFIFAQRAGNLQRISRVSIEKIDTFIYSRQDRPDYGLRGTWAIWDRDMNLVKTSDSLTKKEWRYPLQVRSDHESMCEQIDARWKPQDDKAKVASVAKGRVRIHKHWSVTIPERMNRWDGPSENIQIWRPRLTVTLSMWKKPGSPATNLKRIREMSHERDIVAQSARGGTTLITYGTEHEDEDKPLRAFTCLRQRARPKRGSSECLLRAREGHRCRKGNLHEPYIPSLSATMRCRKPCSKELAGAAHRSAHPGIPESVEFRGLTAR